VNKVMYMTPSTALGSIQWGHTEQILQHTWALTWKAVKPGEVTTLFTLHPYYSARDMGSLFTSLLGSIVADVVDSKTTYDKEDKLVGSSPYEKLMQYKNTLIGLYDISGPDVVYRHYDGFFSKDLQERIEDASGWIFACTPTVYIAVRPLKKNEWIEEKQVWRLRSHDVKNGFILEVKQPEECKSFADFQTAIRANLVELIDFERTLCVRYRTLDGDVLECDYSGRRLVNGRNDDPTDYPLFDSPYLQSAAGSQKMEIKHQNKKMVLDLAKATITY